MRDIDFATLNGTASSIYLFLFVLLGIFWFRNRDIDAAFWWALFPLFQIVNTIISSDVRGFDNELMTYVGNYFIFLSGISLIIGFVKFTKISFNFIFLYIYGALVLFIFLMQYSIGVGFETRITTVSWTTVISTLLCIFVLLRLNEPHYKFEKGFIIFWSLVKLLPILYRNLNNIASVDDPAVPISLNLLAIVILSQIFLTVGLILLSLAKISQQIENENHRSRELQSSLDLALENAELAAAEKSVFLKSMSTELRTPLNGLINYAGKLKLISYGGLNAVQNQYAENIQEKGESLLTLLSNLLESSDVEKGRVEPQLKVITLEKFLKKSEPFFNEIIKINRNQFILTKLTDTNEDLTLYIDQVRATQVLVNLLKNAASYSPVQSKIELTIEKINNKFIRFSIIDQGLGIAIDQYEKIFLPLERGGYEKSTISGYGAGLPNSKNLIETMNGKIDFKSEIGKGSTFWIDLPLMNEEENT